MKYSIYQRLGHKTTFVISNEGQYTKGRIEALITYGDGFRVLFTDGYIFIGKMKSFNKLKDAIQYAESYINSQKGA